MKYLITILLLTTVIIPGYSQENKKDLKSAANTLQMEKIKVTAESKNFVFAARNATPLSGRTLNLTSEYNVSLANDSIFSYLPYQGMSHSAVFGGTENPMIFNQPIDNYTYKETKNGYIIKLSVKNGTDHLKFTFQISENGQAFLNVTSINRQSISYTGDVYKANEK